MVHAGDRGVSGTGWNPAVEQASPLGRAGAAAPEGSDGVETSRNGNGAPARRPAARPGRPQDQSAAPSAGYEPVRRPVSGTEASTFSPVASPYVEVPESSSGS